MLPRLYIGFFLILLFSSEALASGAVARQQNVRAHRHVDLYSDKEKAAPLDPYQQAAADEAAAVAAKAAAKKSTVSQAVKPSAPAYTPPNKVLVSSPVQNNPRQSYQVAVNTPVAVPPTGVQNPNQELARIVSRFDQSSEMWLQIEDMRIKLVILERYIDLYRQNEIYIRKPSMYYANLINVMAASNPSMLTNPFDRVLMIAAITEYDFDNGENPDTLARRILGEQGFQSNKKRLGR